MNRKGQILAIFLGTIILMMTAQGLRPTFQGDPAACAWYTDTSISNPQDDSTFGIPAAPQIRGVDVYDSMDVFARAMNDSLLWYHFPKNQLGTVSLVFPGILRISSSPAVVQRGPNTIDVFVVGASDSYDRNNLYHLTWNGRSWSREIVWENVNPGNVYTASSWGPDRIDLSWVAFDLNGEVFHISWDGRQWSQVESLGFPPGGGNSAPAAGSWGPNHIDVVVKGEGNAYYRNSYDIGGWSGWQSIPGGVFSSSPSVTPTPPFPGGGGYSKIGVFGRGQDMSIYGAGITSDGTASRWWGIGGRLNSAPAAINYIGDHFTVFAKGMDNFLWMLDYDLGEDAEDFQWAPVPDLPGPSPTIVVYTGPTGAPGEVVPASGIGQPSPTITYTGPTGAPGEAVPVPGIIPIWPPIPSDGQMAGAAPDQTATGEMAVPAEVPVGPGFDLTGVWSGDDGGNYEIRQIGNEVWWFGAGPEAWANVAYGSFDAIGQLNMKWADVRGTGYGTLVLKADRDNIEAVIKTGGFAGSILKRSK